MHSSKPSELSVKIRRALRLDKLSPGVRKVLVGLVGGLVLLAGIAMMLLPGPAFIFVPLGLAILALEFAWARHYLQKVRGWYDKARAKRAQKKKATGSTKVSTFS
jgi:uncharacterized protein (TIGR02611 family)